MSGPQSTAPRQRAILVLGDAMLDRFWAGQRRQTGPGDRETVVRISERWNCPGGAANVAANVAALGGESRLLAVIGDDRAGDELSELLAAAGVERLLRRSAEMPTTTKVRIRDETGATVRADTEAAPAAGDLGWLASALDRELGRAGLLLLSDYDKGVLADPSTIIAGCRLRGLPVLVDTKQPRPGRYLGADLLTTTRAELARQFGGELEPATLDRAAPRLLEMTGARALLLKLGADGLALLRPGQPPASWPAWALEVDATGAGDTVIAALAVALIDGQGLEQAVDFANCAAGVVVGKPGTAVATRAELRAAVAMTARRMPWAS